MPFGRRCYGYAASQQRALVFLFLFRSASFCFVLFRFVLLVFVSILDWLVWYGSVWFGSVRFLVLYLFGLVCLA